MVSEGNIQGWFVLIFVSVGANPHPFNRLVEKMDELVRNGEVKEEVILQVGMTPYQPMYVKKCKKFWSIKEYESILKKCNLIISHAGLGNVMAAREHKKPIIVVPRQKRFSEHIDDHQLELSHYLEKNKRCFAVYDIDKLKDKIKIAER